MASSWFRSDTKVVLLVGVAVGCGGNVDSGSVDNRGIGGTSAGQAGGTHIANLPTGGVAAAGGAVQAGGVAPTGGALQTGGARPTGGAASGGTNPTGGNGTSGVQNGSGGTAAGGATTGGTASGGVTFAGAATGGKTGGTGVGGCAGGSHLCAGRCVSSGDPMACGPRCVSCPTDSTGIGTPICRDDRCAFDCGDGVANYCPTEDRGVTAVGCRAATGGTAGSGGWKCVATGCGYDYAPLDGTCALLP
jgi:hypothetical protein